MEAILAFFSTQAGMLTLCGIGLLVAFIFAILLEFRTKKMYYNHEKPEGKDDDDGLFGGLFNFGDDDDDEDEDDEDDEEDSIGDLFRQMRASLDDWDPDDEDEK